MEDEKKSYPTDETVCNKENQAEEIDTLDYLLLDSEETADSKETPEETAEYEAFFAEYRELIGKNLSEAAAKANEMEEQKENELDFLISLPEKRSKKKPRTGNGADAEWHDGITLLPEEYEDLSESAKVMKEDIEEESEPDLTLGDSAAEEEDDFQISINFDGEEKAADKEEEDTEYEYDPEKPRVIDGVFDFIEMFVFVLVAVMILTSFVFRHSVVEGNSMLNTLEEGDHLIISDLFYTPKRGDIVVFEDYSTSLKKAVVKRVIGLPGETVEVRMGADGAFEVYINGEYLDEPYVYTEIDYTAPGVGVWTVGEGEVFVMGDNRYNSTDSRSPYVGPIEIDSILGRVLFRFLPLDKFGAVE